MINNPIFSICIPQYNKSDKLLRLLNSIKIQDFNSYEVCISDGNSTDNSIELAEKFLIKNSINYKISRSNFRRYYDENIRNSIDMSSGKYLILMGNDDVFLNKNILYNLDTELKEINLKEFGFMVTNFEDINTGVKYLRVGNNTHNKKIIKISQIFRALSFVSGLIFNGDSARSYKTNRVDGSEMYQMFLAAKCICDDKFGYLSSLITVKKDSIESPLKLIESNFPLPMTRIPSTIAFGMNLNEHQCNKELISIVNQMYLYIYPYWMVMYKNSNIKLWLKFCFSLHPNKVLLNKKQNIKKVNYYSILILFYTSLIISWSIPKKIFNLLEPILHKIAKWNTRGKVSKNI
jgi:glycosyltransferase involved in cell wall biosynthesis